MSNWEFNRKEEIQSNLELEETHMGLFIHSVKGHVLIQTVEEANEVIDSLQKMKEEWVKQEAKYLVFTEREIKSQVEHLEKQLLELNIQKEITYE